MMMIYNVSNFPNLFETLDQCRESLTLVTPDGRAYDWNENRAFLRSLLQTADVRKFDQMELQLSGAQDASRIICYMMEGERS